MKTIKLIILISILSITSLFAQKTLQLDSIVVVDQQDGYFQSGDFYFGGQPNLETVKWLKEQGVSVIINLRSDNENDGFKKSAFNEKRIVKKEGFEYISIPISGKDAYSPETLKKFAIAIKPGKNADSLSKWRKSPNSFMAYLVKYQNYSLNDAIDFGKQLGYTDYLELLLGETVEYK